MKNRFHYRMFVPQTMSSLKMYGWKFSDHICLRHYVTSLMCNLVSASWLQCHSANIHKTKRISNDKHKKLIFENRSGFTTYLHRHIGTRTRTKFALESPRSHYPTEQVTLFVEFALDPVCSTRSWIDNFAPDRTERQAIFELLAFCRHRK